MQSLKTSPALLTFSTCRSVLFC